MGYHPATKFKTNNGITTEDPILRINILCRTHINVSLGSFSHNLSLSDP